jgi:hypothetical protein
MFRYSFIMVAISYCFQIQSAFSDEVRNGGDSRPPWENASWFVGQSPVRVCFEHSDEFGVTEAFAKSQFRRALTIWTQYADQKKIWPSESKYRISSNFQLLARCSGREDLKIKLGVIDTETRKAQSELALQNPTAFAYRSSFHPRSGRGKGFIWIKKSSQETVPWKFPDWSKNDTLQGMFLHELGHVFGNTHIEGSIMTESIVSVIKSWTWSDNPAPDTPKINEIDWDVEFAICGDCALSKSGRLSQSPLDEYTQVKNFKFLTGREPSGTIEAKVDQRELLGRIYTGTITVRDSLGSTELRYTLNKDFNSYSGGASVFYSYVDGAYAVGSTHGSVIYFGTIELANSNQVPITLERNMNFRQVSINILRDGLKIPIFMTPNSVDSIPTP